MRIGSSRNLGDLVVSMPSKTEWGAEKKTLVQGLKRP